MDTFDAIDLELIPFLISEPEVKTLLEQHSIKLSEALEDESFPGAIAGRWKSREVFAWLGY